MKKLRYCLVLPALVMALLLLGSCASKSSRFYTLNPVLPSVSSGKLQSTPLSDTSSVIGIVAVEIPDYLDRPQIVTRNENNELKLAEFDRWGGELQRDIARVLAETMTAGLPGRNVFVLTGRRAMLADYRISVQVTRFDPMPDNLIWLNATWTVHGKDGVSVTVRGESTLTEPIKGTGYKATVAAMSRTVDKLGAEIVGAMKPVLTEAALNNGRTG